MRTRFYLLMMLVVPCAIAAAEEVDVMERVEHHFADSDGVKIHYVTMGEGPLVVFIHGFPDFWYSWHHQMAGLAEDFRVAALDTRGYNQSDKPEGKENYDMTFLVADVAAVIKSEGRNKAIIVGHDWGGAIAWTLAMTMPELVDKLIIVNLPHPKGMARELSSNPEQHSNSQYARDFQKPDSHKNLNAKMLAGFVGNNPNMRAKYEKAFENSSFDAMMNYYRQNYPREPYEENVADLPKITVPVLQFHGLTDRALHHHALNQTWEHLEKDYTLVTIPGVGHWAHHEAADLVTTTMKWWLLARQ